MDIYPALVIAFCLFVIGFGLYLYTKRTGGTSLAGSILCLAGLVLVLVTVIAWLLPGFFFNLS
jgi:hypothetical protein